MTMHIENLHVGDSITILRGNVVHTCPMGCCQSERYEDFKGLPLIVLAINAPYVVAANVIGQGGKVLDSRHCELTKCTNEYVDAFRLMVGGTSVRPLNPAAAIHSPPEVGGAECVGN